MDVVGWLWWLLTTVLGLLWSMAWFMLGGWVATLAQIGIIMLVIFGYKYGWRQAPQEVLGRAATFTRFAWAWIRAKEPPQRAPASSNPREHGNRTGSRRRQPGDVQINLSTLLSVVMLAGLGLMATLK